MCIMGDGGAGGGGGDSGSEFVDEPRERRAGLDDLEAGGCSVKMGGGGVISRAAASDDATAAGGGGGGCEGSGGGGGGAVKIRKCTGRPLLPLPPPTPDSDDCDPAADRVGGEDGAEGAADPAFAGVEGALGGGDDESESLIAEADRAGNECIKGAGCCGAMIGGGGGGEPVSNDPVLVELSLRVCSLMADRSTRVAAVG